VTEIVMNDFQLLPSRKSDDIAAAA
jgi:hypothetical protein